MVSCSSSSSIFQQADKTCNNNVISFTKVGNQKGKYSTNPCLRKWTTGPVHGTEHRHTIDPVSHTTVTVTVTVTEALVLRILLEDRGRITESIRILVHVDRIKQKCSQITTKQVRRSQQFQLRR